MGITSNAAVSTLIRCDKNLQIEFPQEWTLQKAATVPIVYATVLCAFMVRIRDDYCLMVIYVILRFRELK